VRAPAFLIVGTPRSGTTLVQRLACELPGVRTPPETHFFGYYALDLVRRRRFPISGDVLRDELDAFANMPKSKELGLDIVAWHGMLAGRAERPADMFATLVEVLVGQADTVGEKSPEHLLWWRPIARAFPALRFIAVVRDPRGVVSSSRAVWGDAGGTVAVRAERWNADQREVSRALRSLGSERVLVIRYEDVVSDESAASAAIAAYLGVPARTAAVAGRSPAAGIVLPREWWKGRTFEPVTTERVEAWRRDLSVEDADTVGAICRHGMRRFGYSSTDTRRPVAPAGLPTRAQRWRFRAARRRHLARINRVIL